jgi:hypothetical protein
MCFHSHLSLLTFIQSIEALHIKSYSSCLYIMLYSAFQVVPGNVEHSRVQVIYFATTNFIKRIQYNFEIYFDNQIF